MLKEDINNTANIKEGTSAQTWRKVKQVVFCGFWKLVSLKVFQSIFLLKFWIYENHISKLQSEELKEGWSSQLYKQLLQLQKKKSLKKKIQACMGFEPLTSEIPVQRSTN